jgi:hypothetical protein
VARRRTIEPVVERFFHLEEERQQRVLLVERLMQWVALLGLLVLLLAGLR